MIVLERSFSNHNFSGIIILCEKEGKEELQGEKGEGKQGEKKGKGYYWILCYWSLPPTLPVVRPAVYFIQIQEVHVEIHSSV